MTEQEKQLLLADLCARLPYAVICRTTSVYYDNDDNEIGQAEGRLVSINRHGACFFDDKDGTTFGADFVENSQIGFKPYLRPMSSMSKEERAFYFAIDEASFTCVDWLNAHHFDYRGLIEKGLALEAPEGMYGENC